MAAKKQPKEQGVIDLLMCNFKSNQVCKGLLADFPVELGEMQLLNFGED